MEHDRKLFELGRTAMRLRYDREASTYTAFDDAFLDGFFAAVRYLELPRKLAGEEEDSFFDGAAIESLFYSKPVYQKGQP